MAASPPLKTNRSADKCEVFTNPSTVNLTTRSGKPNFAPQKLVIVSTASNACTLVDEAGTSHSFTLPAGTQPVPFDRPVVTLSAAAGIVFAYWYTIAGKDDFAYPAFTTNP